MAKAKAKDNTIQTGRNPKYRYQYAVKFICFGRQSKTISLIPGLYRTAVNIHNPNEKSVEYRSKLATAKQISEWRPEKTLKDDQVAHINCRDIRKYKLPPASGFEGFLVIESTRRLDVVAVYTAAPMNRELATMDVERVRGRRING